MECTEDVSDDPDSSMVSSHDTEALLSVRSLEMSSASCAGSSRTLEPHPKSLDDS